MIPLAGDPVPEWTKTKKPHQSPPQSRAQPLRSFKFKAGFHASLIQAGMKLTLNLRYRTREVIELGKTYRTSLSQRGAKVFPDLKKCLACTETVIRSARHPSWTRAVLGCDSSVFAVLLSNDFSPFSKNIKKSYIISYENFTS